MTDEDIFEHEVIADQGVFILSGNIAYSATTAIIKWILEI